MGTRFWLLPSASAPGHEGSAALHPSAKLVDNAANGPLMTAKPSAPTPRGTAVEVLCLWATTHNSIDSLFQSAVSQLADIDRGLAKSLVYGVLRQKQFLDYIIRGFSKHPLTKMKPRTLMTLRIGVYQLLFLRRMPESAAVNATVNTLKAAGQPAWLIGFVNGLLRGVARNRAALPTPEELAGADPPILNHPAWLTDRWQTRFGTETTWTICCSNNSDPCLTLRINSRRTSVPVMKTVLTKTGIISHKGLYSPSALRIDNFPGSIAALPGYEQGHFQVQDEAAQLATLLVGPLPDRCRVLDGCAGLGGKTSHLAELLPPGGSIVAVEPEPRRFGLLRENLNRLGLTEQVRCVRSDLQTYATTRPQPFDAILIDAPCSGTGVIRRQPDIRWNRHPEDLARYQRNQLHLLETAASLLKPGGVLVYATCSLEAEENEETVQLFLQRCPRFAVENAADFVPEPARRLVDASGFFRTTPADEIDGFFAARLIEPRGL
ncbi:16S rRNA (cytosine(967)-C(5))-methyltransferase RsmB [Desulfobulbus alkaliphilus]|uniref:16S rRNA (cytosine(967)-C(5))-methyltransferase RsmB n=1 Tax=Desulfobulbus alkaliphilus TaxID=869814 RepID=UPI001965A83D|nr:16S rRNA (cytosine(967)-C(5))-methyltransferase RsmB [Desulfobulbus alkaliphilus]MBM9538589.1 16S rRNA (cytosine(967)-C(5))-methyltransferase RsmB [Desulfobulbus alkaliphilus]